MRKYMLSLLVFLLVSACTDEANREQNFFNTYREILILREIGLDSVTANKKVQEIISKHGYDEQTFKQEFFNIAKNNNKFVKIIDSLRQSIISDTTIFKQ